MAWKILASFLLQALAVIAINFQEELQRRQALPAVCTDWSSAVDYCRTATPGFVSLPLSEQAPCLCYSDTVWLPSIFDNWATSCAAWVSTNDPADFTIVDGWVGLCTDVGDVINSPKSTAVSTTAVLTTATSSHLVTTAPTITAAPTSTDIWTHAGCSFLSFAISYCESVSPGFTDMASSSQAPCLCYSSTMWSPNGFDGPVSTCADYAKTANPSLYPDISSLEGFCSKVGDVTAAGATVSAQTTGGGNGGGGVGIPLTNSQGGGQTTSTNANTVATVTTKPSTTSSVSVTASVQVSTSTKSAGGYVEKGVAGWVGVYVVVELAVAGFL